MRGTQIRKGVLEAMKMTNCYKDEYKGEIFSHMKEIEVRFKRSILTALSAD